MFMKNIEFGATIFSKVIFNLAFNSKIVQNAGIKSFNKTNKLNPTRKIFFSSISFVQLLLLRQKNDEYILTAHGMNVEYICM